MVATDVKMRAAHQAFETLDEKRTKPGLASRDISQSIAFQVTDAVASVVGPTCFNVPFQNGALSRTLQCIIRDYLVAPSVLDSPVGICRITGRLRE